MLTAAIKKAALKIEADCWKGAIEKIVNHVRALNDPLASEDQLPEGALSESVFKTKVGYEIAAAVQRDFLRTVGMDRFD